MRSVKLFFVTFIIVVLVGGVGLACMPEAAMSISQSSVSSSAEKKSEDVATKETKKITIDSANIVPSYGGNVDGDVINKDKNNVKDQDTLSGSITGYEAMYEDAKNTSVIYPSVEGKITISFAGDILFDPAYSVYATYKDRGCDISQCISPLLLDKMRNTDIMMVNNEFPYSEGGNPLENKAYTFRAPVSSVRLLDDMGVDIVSVANNHIYDYGEQAFMDTLYTLENAGMPYVGAGRNLEDASRPYYFVVNGKKIAIIAASQIEKTWNPDTKGATETTPGVFRCLESTNLCNAIRKAKEECDFVILYVHWGTESTDVIDSQQITEAPKYVEAGADIIIGDHPHVLQPVEYINGVPVIYSLANFWFNSKTQDTCLVTLTLNIEDASIDSLQFEPCMQTNMSTILLSGDEKARVLNYMRSISRTAAFDNDGYITEK